MCNKVKNDVENYKNLIQSIFNESISISPQFSNNTNNCIGALFVNDSFTEFSKNFKERLQRLKNAYTTLDEKKEVLEKIKNIAEEEGVGWAGPYSELVVLDLLSDLPYIRDKDIIKVKDLKIDDKPNSLAERDGQSKIDIDVNFKYKFYDFFADIKSFKPNDLEILNKILDEVRKKSSKKILIGIDNFISYGFCETNKLLPQKMKEIVQYLLEEINNNSKYVTYEFDSKYKYSFRIEYLESNNTLMTESTKSPYQLATADSFKLLNYSNKLLPSDYSFLVLVKNPWFNCEIDDFCSFNKIYYRSLCRRLFIEHGKDNTPAKMHFPKMKNYSISIAEISNSIAGVLIIEDNSIVQKSNKLYDVYMYLNPNYKCKKPLSVFDLQSLFSGSKLCELKDMDDFFDDNY